ncbi:MAG TPA: hypothetical protein VF690_09845, partial [Hymenobacter sp.]
MTNLPFFAALLLALPLAVTAQTKTSPVPKPPTKTATVATAPGQAMPATQQVTEVTEELDPATGKVIRRTTRTTTVPAGTVAPGTTSAPTTAADPVSTTATDAQVTTFLRKKT